MAVFASLTGKLAQLLSLSKSNHMLHSHMCSVLNLISKHSKQLRPWIRDAQVNYGYNAME